MRQKSTKCILQQALEHIMCLNKIVNIDISDESKVFDHERNEGRPRTAFITFLILCYE